MKKYSNAFVFVDGRFEKTGFEVTEEGRFGLISPSIDDGEDLEESYVIPGLVDTHIHGAMGSDFSEASPEGLQKMGRYLASQGITSFLATSATVPYEQLEQAYKNGLAYIKEWDENVRNGHFPDCAYLDGIHMEGPFFSPAKKGAQNPAYLKTPDYEAFKKLQDIAEGTIRIVDVAPELPGALDFIRKATTCRVSLAHTAATYEEAKAGFEAGATRVTHLFNAMSGLGHREPGVVGAAAERDNVQAELICDGHHVHPSAVRAAFKLFPGRICLISDALCCLGMRSGQYSLGGLDVYMKDNLARLGDGTIAGAATNLYDAMLNAVRFGIAKEEAIKAVTENPARSVDAFYKIGSIREGKRADFVVCDADLNRKWVALAGRRL